MGINLLHADQHERDGENQSAQQVDSSRDEQCLCNHGAALSAGGAPGPNSELSESLITVRMVTIEPRIIPGTLIPKLAW